MWLYRGALLFKTLWFLLSHVWPTSALISSVFLHFYVCICSKRLFALYVWLLLCFWWKAYVQNADSCKLIYVNEKCIFGTLLLQALNYCELLLLFSCALRSASAAECYCCCLWLDVSCWICWIFLIFEHLFSLFLWFITNRLVGEYGRSASDCILHPMVWIKWWANLP